MTFAESLKLMPVIVIEKLEIQFYKHLTRKFRFFATWVWKIANKPRSIGQMTTRFSICDFYFEHQIGSK